MINEQLLTLYRDFYGDRISEVIPCGVVDETVYSRVYPRIVFILREAHMRTPYNIKSEWTLPKGISRNVDIGLTGKPMELKYMRTWKQAGVWAYAIIHGFDTYNKLKKDICVAKGLQAIAMTNLKKTGGAAASKWREIRDHAVQDKSLWQRELEIMNPDLIICGGTYGHVTRVLELQSYPLYEDNSRKYRYSTIDINSKQCIVLDFWHPNNRRNRQSNVDVLRKLMELIQKAELLEG